MSLTADTGLEILQIAQEGGYLEEDLPEDDDEIISLAEMYLTHARAAEEAGKADDFIERIVALGESDGYVKPKAEPEPEEEQEEEQAEPEAEPEPEEKPKRRTRKKKEPEPEPETDPDIHDPDAEALPVITKDNLPLPQQIEGDPPVMPRDISECSDKQIRRLASEFQACLNVAIHLYKRTMDKVLRTKQLRAAAYREAYLLEEAAAREAGLKPTKEALDMAAQQAPAYKKLDDELFELERLAGDYKMLKEIYEGNVSRLSREATIRDDEYKRSGRT